MSELRLPIYVLHDSGVDLLERNAVLDGVCLAARNFPGPRVISYYGTDVCPSGLDAEEYINKAPKNERGQVDSRELVQILRNDPWKKKDPHITVLFTSKDLCPPGLNFAFGQMWDTVTVQSVFRYRNLSNSDRELMIQEVVEHELGHVFGLAGDLSRSHTEEKLGPHCTNRGCVMRQYMNLDEGLKHARESKEMKIIYCPECLREAEKASI